MKNYFTDTKTRKTVQFALIAVQLILMISALVFMTLFVTTPVPSGKNYSTAAITLSILWGVFYAAQLVFAAVTYVKTPEKNKTDLLFLIVSAVLIAVGIGIYGIITLCL